MMISRFTRYCILIALMLPFCSVAQNRNNIWCFGDSAGIDFNNTTNPIPISTSLVTRGSCASIADTSGNLLLYCSTRSGWPGDYSGFIWNRVNDLMLGGDSIGGEGWYHEMVIVPDPADDSLFLVFSNGVTTAYGLMYSIVDMRGDNGLGEVIQKNISLLSGLLVDCVTAIKHGNGRDWWVMVRESPVGQPTYNNTWLLFLISPSGINPIPVQNVGEFNGTNLGNIAVSPAGTKICFTNLGGLIELYDFNRCTGLVSNPVTIEPQLSSSPYPYYWASEFSPSGQYLYVSSSTQISRLWQFDTWAPNILSTKTLLWQVQNPANTAGALKRGPDNKIYFACSWSGGGFNFPYNNSQYFPENMNLGVIHSPDLAGLACNYLPWSFYLGGKRTYKGLPNNPDYDLGPLVGSSCDTLVSINPAPANIHPSELFVYYHPGWQTAFINAQRLIGHNYRLRVYDIRGEEVFSESGKLNPPYFTKNLNCALFAKGMYIVLLETEKEKLTKKFVIE
ncbi:MAG: T9SS type A sorting domain-containing protein [Bacteroidetes bacterium]|nr:T9SS type A sorting domain-containing protein [Bacteroidota bacterium]